MDVCSNIPLYYVLSGLAPHVLQVTPAPSCQTTCPFTVSQLSVIPHIRRHTDCVLVSGTGGDPGLGPTLRQPTV